MNLHPLFAPRSIAVIGASTKTGSVGYTLAENLFQNGYAGDIYLVNPKATTLFDRPCYPDLASLPAVPDLVIIVIPASAVPDVLEKAGQLGVQAAVIISSGFKETGQAGTQLEEAVSRIAARHRMPVLGPNCLGFLHPKLGLNASFAKFLPEPGDIAFFSQSGALSTALLDLTRGELGYRAFVSTGNKAVLDERRLLEYWSQDPDTRLIGFYAEGLAESSEFIRLGRSLLGGPAPKLAIGLKSGMTAAGTSASSSHTGALAGSAEAYRALFTQARVTRAETFGELLAALTVFSNNPLPNGNRLAIVTNAGGLGVLATDEAARAGLELATLSDAARTALGAFLPKAASLKNPIDILGDASGERYQNTLEVVARDAGVDILLVIVTPQTTTEDELTARAIAACRTQSEKPIVAVLAGKDSLEKGRALLRKEGIACLAAPEDAVLALARLSRAGEWQREAPHRPFAFGRINYQGAEAVIQGAASEGRNFLSENQVAEVLSAYGLPLLASKVARSPEEAVAFATELSSERLVLKIVSPDIIHKSDVGGVLLNISREEIGGAYQQLLATVRERAPQARIEGVLVMEMAPGDGVELFLGVKRESGLGPLLAFGLGGIYVETLKDLSFRFAPVSREDAGEMIEEITSLALLKGARGRKETNLERLAEYIGRLSALVTDFPAIAEIDINPLLVFPDGKRFAVLDARIKLADAE